MYHFVCKNCENTIQISDKDIENKVDEFNEWYNKQRALEKIKKNESEEIHLYRIGNTDICFQSVGAYLTIDHYKKQGIDITKLSREHIK